MSHTDAPRSCVEARSGRGFPPAHGTGIIHDLGVRNIPREPTHVAQSAIDVNVRTLRSALRGA